MTAHEHVRSAHEEPVRALYRAYRDLKEGRKEYDRADDAAFLAARIRDEAAAAAREREEVLRLVVNHFGLAGENTPLQDVELRTRIAIAIAGYEDPPDYAPQEIFDVVRETLGALVSTGGDENGASRRQD